MDIQNSLGQPSAKDFLLRKFEKEQRNDIVKMIEDKKNEVSQERNLGEIPVKQDAITDECSIFKQKMVVSERKNINYIFWLPNLTVKSKKNLGVTGILAEMLHGAKKRNS